MESKEEMDVPDIIVVGAPRSGTTSLYNYLQQHPQVFMSSLKETRFFAYEGREVDYQGPADAYAFNRNTVTDAESYRQLFAGRESGQRTGEASPVYLYRSDRAAERIYNYAPEARLIAIFRNPIERAYSDFLNMVRLGWEPLRDFEKALQAEDSRIDAHWSPFYHYRSKGFYAERLQPYFEFFDRDQMCFFLFQDLKRDADAVMAELLSFLNLDPGISIDTGVQHNRSGLPKIEALHFLLTHPIAERAMRGPLRDLRTTLRDMNTAHEKPSLDPAVRATLAEVYRDDIQKLETMIGRDLSHWLS